MDQKKAYIEIEGVPFTLTKNLKTALLSFENSSFEILNDVLDLVRDGNINTQKLAENDFEFESTFLILYPAPEKDRKVALNSWERRTGQKAPNGSMTAIEGERHAEAFYIPQKILIAIIGFAERYYDSLWESSRLFQANTCESDIPTYIIERERPSLEELEQGLSLPDESGNEQSTEKLRQFGLRTQDRCNEKLFWLSRWSLKYTTKNYLHWLAIQWRSEMDRMPLFSLSSRQNYSYLEEVKALTDLESELADLDRIFSKRKSTSYKALAEFREKRVSFKIKLQEFGFFSPLFFEEKLKRLRFLMQDYLAAYLIAIGKLETYLKSPWRNEFLVGATAEQIGKANLSIDFFRLSDEIELDQEGITKIAKYEQAFLRCQKNEFGKIFLSEDQIITLLEYEIEDYNNSRLIRCSSVQLLAYRTLFGEVTLQKLQDLEDQTSEIFLSGSPFQNAADEQNDLIKKRAGLFQTLLRLGLLSERSGKERLLFFQNHSFEALGDLYNSVQLLHAYYESPERALFLEKTDHANLLDKPISLEWFKHNVSPAGYSPFQWLAHCEDIYHKAPVAKTFRIFSRIHGRRIAVNLNYVEDNVLKIVSAELR